MKNGSDFSSPDKTIMRQRFLLDTLQLGSGTALAQGITILSVPVLSRIYAPESFGIAALFGSIVIILSIISGLRYELAIILPENDSDGFALFLLHAGLSVLSGAITGLIFWEYWLLFGSCLHPSLQ